MIEKLKALGEAAKNIVIFILGPILALIAYILYITGQKNKLQEKIADTKVEKELADTLAKKEEKKNEADNAVADYERIRDEYIRRQFTGESAKLLGGDSSSGQGSKEEG